MYDIDILGGSNGFCSTANEISGALFSAENLSLESISNAAARFTNRSSGLGGQLESILRNAQLSNFGSIQCQLIYSNVTCSNVMFGGRMVDGRMRFVQQV